MLKREKMNLDDRKRIEEIRAEKSAIYLACDEIVASDIVNKIDFLLAHIDKVEAALREFHISEKDDGTWLTIGQAAIHFQKFGPIVRNNIRAAIQKAREVLGEE